MIKINKIDFSYTITILYKPQNKISDLFGEFGVIFFYLSLRVYELFI